MFFHEIRMSLNIEREGDDMTVLRRLAIRFRTCDIGFDA